MTWIVRILLLIAAPIAALFVARDELNFRIFQIFIAMLLIVAVLTLVAIVPSQTKT